MVEVFREHDPELGLLVARIGALYTKQRLSPPFHLRDTARRWRGISQDDIVKAIEKHYTWGAGEQHFALLQVDIQRAWRDQHPPLACKEKPKARPKRGLVRKVHRAAKVLAAAPVTYHLRRDDGDYVVFCFVYQGHAEAFRIRFGGELLPRR